MAQVIIPGSYWDDYSDRSPFDEPAQMAHEVKRAGNRVTIEANAIQLKYLNGAASVKGALNAMNARHRDEPALRNAFPDVAPRLARPRAWSLRRQRRVQFAMP